MAETKKITIIDKTVPHLSAWHMIAGIIMVLLGIYVWFNPAATLMALALYLGIVFIVLGVGYFAFSFTFDSGWYMFIGLLDLFVGIIFVSNLGVTAASMPVIFALWCLAVGVVQVVTAFQFKSAELPWSWSMTAGIIGILFAFLILAFPSLGVFTLTFLMGAYIVLFGIVEIAEYTSNRRLIAA